jgi:pimeloyl-ACP methyl ester carboxylesterase
MAVYMGEQFVESGSVRLCVREYGEDGPHVVLVHGYPDDQSLWDGVVERLEGVHAITYDVRGAGSSSVPARIREYRNDRLTDDLVAVVEATVPEGEQFHLVGHDWGSIGSWDSLQDPRLSGRIASYVSASGPSIDHVAATFRGRPPHGLARQLAHSFYIGAFQVPRVPELLWRSEHRLTPRMVGLIAAQGGESQWSPRLAHNGANGVNLYRANMLPKILRPAPARIDLPVVLVVAGQDTFVGEPYVAAAQRFCSDVRRVEVDAGHWHPRSRPELMAVVLTDHLATVNPT